MPDKCCKKSPEQKPEAINAPEVLNVDKIINVDELKENSVLVFKFANPTQGVMLTLNALRDRYGKQMREKNITAVLISPEDDVSTLDEAKMAELGWVRKQEESRLILP